ncbi:unnamed protein product [Linum trigynum]|uniref:Uncharacterized protein n=1 Tax=Linum trigynum TaxID=586398 RepID=A0AAV2ETF2_9ROSI
MRDYCRKMLECCDRMQVILDEQEAKRRQWQIELESKLERIARRRRETSNCQESTAVAPTNFPTPLAVATTPTAIAVPSPAPLLTVPPTVAVLAPPGREKELTIIAMTETTTLLNAANAVEVSFHTATLDNT